MATYVYQHSSLVATVNGVQRWLEALATGQDDQAQDLETRYQWADGYMVTLLSELVPALPGYLQPGVLACLALRAHIRSAEYLQAYHATGGTW